MNSLFPPPDAPRQSSGKLRQICFALIVLLITDATAFHSNAEDRRGMITSSNCPLTCEDLQVPRNACKERLDGLNCIVEDLRQPAGFQTLVRVRGGQVVEQEPEAPAVLPKTNPVPSQGKNQGRGFITSSSCPFSCAQAGVPKEFCVERRNGASCEVEDLRQGPGFQTLMRVPK